MGKTKLEEKNGRSAGEILRLHVDEIIVKWEANVRNDISAAKNRERRILRNSMPEFLEALAMALSLKKGIAEDYLRQSRLHARERASLGDYTLPEMLREYHHLRQVILETVPALVEERKCINDSIDFAVAEAADEFLQQVLENERREKEKLTKALAELDSEKELRQKFVVALTHDLRTPISAIKMAVELLARNLGDPALLVQKIETNCKRADRMIQDLLDARFIQAGKKLPIQCSDVDLFQVASEVVENMSGLHNRDIQIKGEYSSL